MDSPAAVELVRPWRTATVVAAVIAGLELVLLVVAGLIIAGRSLAPDVKAAGTHRTAAPEAAAPAPTQASRPPRVVARIPRSKTGVMILNGNGVHGAAAQAASLVGARGYPVKEVGNAPRTGYPRWQLMYRPGYAGEARRFARDLGLAVSRVGPLDGLNPAQLRGAKLLLLLGAQR